jgi:hypothetical protein
MALRPDYSTLELLFCFVLTGLTVLAGASAKPLANDAALLQDLTLEDSLTQLAPL